MQLNPRTHAGKVRRAAKQVTALQLKRRAVLGIEPKLVLVIDLEGAVDSGVFSAANLRLLEARRGEAVVAFADDPQLAAFQERIQAYEDADAEKAPPHGGLIDKVAGIRRYGPEDRATERLDAARAELAGDDELLIDLECWHPDNQVLAGRWGDELATAVEEAQGQVLDRYANHTAGLLLTRARVPESAIDDLLELDQLARVDGAPHVPPLDARPSSVTLDDLPELVGPPDDAPIVGIVDSGVQSGHPLIAPALLDAVTLSSDLPDGEDGHGHGTRVAALLLHGSLDNISEQAVLARPFSRLLSVRVLGPDNAFPPGSVWEGELERAIAYCADQGAKVINVSIGDPDTPYRAPYSTPVAGLLDALARERDLVIIVPTGNVELAQYLQPTDTAVDEYAVALASNDETVMIDPAPAALALTVGGTCQDGYAGALQASATATRVAIGAKGWPSPFTRRGPGIAQSIKPELSAPAGSAAFDHELGFLYDPSLEITSASASPDRVLDVDGGTSYAAPLVARIAAAIVRLYPGMGANLIRALTLQSAAEPEFAHALLTGDKAARQRLVEALVGHGEASLEKAATSSDHRTVLVAETEIDIDGTHVYEVPIPRSFFVSGGERGIDVALCFDPETRIRRQDYLACKMEFYLVRGMEPEEIEEVFLRTDPDELEAEEELDEGEDDSDEEAADGEKRDDEDSVARKNPPPSSLGSRLLKMQPAGQNRSRGANQLGRKVLRHRLKEDQGDTYYLVVQCRRQWAAEDDNQSYALAVCLWRSEDSPEIYADLRARVEVEVPVEVEIERY